MKKVILSMALMVAGMSVVFAAAPTKYADISMGASQITLAERADWSDAYDNGYDAYAYNPNGLAIVSGGQRYVGWATNNLDNVELELIALSTPVTADITLTFSNVIGDIHLNVNGTDVTLANGGSVVLPAADFGTDGKYTKSLKIAKAPATPEFCFAEELLKVNGYAGKSLEIWKEGAASAMETVSALPATYQKDFSAEAAGKYIIKFDGVTNVFTDGLVHEYVIDVKPATTKKP